jgi:hypothetical protein
MLGAGALVTGLSELLKFREGGAIGAALTETGTAVASGADPVTALAFTLAGLAGILFRDPGSKR